MDGSSTVVYTPDQNGVGSVPAWLAMNNGGFGGFGGGLGGGILGFLLGLFFGNGWNGMGAWGNGMNGAGAGFLSNQINNDSGRELLMNAINSQGEASRAAVQNLATMLGQDFNLVNSGVSAIRDGIASLTAQTGMSALQIINAIQGGNADMSLQLCKCCCDQRQLTVEQGYQNQLATVNQTNTLMSGIADLKATMIDQFCSAEKRDMQDKINVQSDIITQLRGQLDNDRQTAQFQAMLAPIQAQVNTIASKQVNTVPVQWPALTAVNTTPYVNGGYYGNGFGWGNGVNF